MRRQGICTFLVFGLMAAQSLADPVEEPWEAHYQAGCEAESRGRYAEAESHYKDAIETARSIGVGEQRLAECYRSLAFNLDLQGRFAEAEGLAKKALDLQEKAQGAESPEIAPFLATLAGTYTYLGREAEAEALYRRILAIKKKSLGPDHPEVASVLTDIAMCCLNRGKPDRAEPLLTKALAIQLASGRETRELAKSLFSLSRMKFDQGHDVEAETDLKRCLKVQERVYGLEHPEVATTLNAFVAVYEKQGKFDAAEPYSRRALSIAEKSLRADHPDLGLVLYNRGTLCQHLNRNTEAEAAYKRALLIWKNGDSDPRYSQSVIWSLQNCAMVLRKNGKADEGDTMDARAAEILARQGRPATSR